MPNVMYNLRLFDHVRWSAACKIWCVILFAHQTICAQKQCHDKNCFQMSKFCVSPKWNHFRVVQMTHQMMHHNSLFPHKPGLNVNPWRNHSPLGFGNPCRECPCAARAWFSRLFWTSQSCWVGIDLLNLDNFSCHQNLMNQKRGTDTMWKHDVTIV